MLTRFLGALLIGTLLANSAGIASAGMPSMPGDQTCDHGEGAPAEESCCPADALQSCCELTCLATPALNVEPALALPRYRAIASFIDPSNSESRHQIPPTRPPISPA